MFHSNNNKVMLTSSAYYIVSVVLFYCDVVVAGWHRRVVGQLKWKMTMLVECQLLLSSQQARQAFAVLTHLWMKRATLRLILMALMQMLRMRLLASKFHQTLSAQTSML